MEGEKMEAASKFASLPFLLLLLHLSYFHRVKKSSLIVPRMRSSQEWERRWKKYRVT